MGNKDFSRRGFLKTLGLTGAALTIGPAFNKVEAATAIVEGRKTITGNNALPHRTLGTGKAALFTIQTIFSGGFELTKLKFILESSKSSVKRIIFVFRIHKRKENLMYVYF